MKAEDIEEYYRILGLTDTATLDEIKRAYRKKAKAFHPDKNKSPDAAEQFILFTEAYEFLVNYKEGKVVEDQSITVDWEAERESARQQARQYADMRYEEFKKTDYYKTSQAAATVFEHLYFFSSVLIMLSPIWGVIIIGPTGFIAGIFIAFISVQYWAGIFKEEINIDLNSFFQSLVLIIRTRTFRYGVVTILNLILVFRFTLHTQLTLGEFALALISLYAIAFLFYILRLTFMKAFAKTGVFLCVIPTLFNIFFSVNYIFSSNPAFEKYSFVHETRGYGSRRSGGHQEKIAYIDLENGKYYDYPWFRMFYDFEAMQYKSEIEYRFEDGLLGLRVLKGFEFTK